MAKPGFYGMNLQADLAKKARKPKAKKRKGTVAGNLTKAIIKAALKGKRK